MTELYSDPEVEMARRNRGVVDAGKWRVRLPAVFGFCGGVLNAIRLLQRKLVELREHQVWLLGEIIHNDTVNSFFRKVGVRIIPEDQIDSVFDLATPSSDIIVIPAFGIPKSLDTRLRQTFPNDQIVDTTCAYVRRIWRFAERMIAENRTIVVHGKPNHPETRATLSRALTAQNAVLLIPSISAAEQLATAIKNQDISSYPPELVRNREKLHLNHLALVNQTTMLFSETKEVERILQNAMAAIAGELVSSETVCHSTQHRQNAALELCQEGCDVMIVVGGYTSSNTNQLYRLAKATGPTYFVRDADALDRNEIRHYQPEMNIEEVTRDWLPEEATIGILAGASCPAADIGDLIRKFKSFATPTPAPESQ